MYYGRTANAVVVLKKIITHLSDFAIFSYDDTSKRIAEAWGVGANQGTGLIHMGTYLEKLKKNIVVMINHSTH